MGDLIFGMSEVALVNTLGHPYSTTVDEYGDIELVYPVLNMCFTFWKASDNRLGIISTQRVSANFAGERLIYGAV